MVRAASVAVVALAVGCNSDGSSNTPSDATTGGALGSGGTTALPTGGSVSTGGAATQATGGTTSQTTGGTTSQTTGGVATGGAATGGAASGVATGGAASGVATGGAASGGVGTGGVGTGGTATETPGVRVVGRTADGSNGAIRFSWPGVALHARFNGTQVSLNVSGGSNRFTVTIDGGAPKTVTSGAQPVVLATGLSDGPHEVSVFRNTEAPAGVSEFSGFSGFSAGGALLAPPAAPDRRIEVIGDSLSAGAGVEGTSTSCSPNIDAFTNNYLAYGSVAARALGADVVNIAWSGIGVYRSYSASDPTMPARYDYSIPNDQTPWDFSRFAPHVVVINLGTNDFGPGNPGKPYVDAYVAFAQHVREKYASAPFVLIDMYGGERATAIQSVISALKDGGETKTSMLSFSSVPNNNTACNQHPNTAAQKQMGDLLVAHLQTLLGW